MRIDFTGKVCKTYPVQSGIGQRGPWSRATVVFEVQDSRFPEKIACDNIVDAENFSRLQLGTMVHVKADISSREYNEKWYTSIVCFFFERMDVQNQSQSQHVAPAPSVGVATVSPTPPATVSAPAPEFDDLPV